MALNDLLIIANNNKKIGISEERINEIKKPLRKYFAFWRMYPDLFVDFMQTGGKSVYLNDKGQRCYQNDSGQEVKLTFSLFFYQRVVQVLLQDRYLLYMYYC